MDKPEHLGPMARSLIETFAGLTLAQQRRVFAAISEIMQEREALARIGELKVPLLCLQGTGDRLVNPAVADEIERRATVPATVKRYEGAYHETFNDTDREKVFADIDAWLEAPLAAAEVSRS